MLARFERGPWFSWCSFISIPKRKVLDLTQICILVIEVDACSSLRFLYSYIFPRFRKLLFTRILFVRFLDRPDSSTSSDIFELLTKIAHSRVSEHAVLISKISIAACVRESKVDIKFSFRASPPSPLISLHADSYFCLMCCYPF